MPITPITIDNLGPGASERYAKDQATLQEDVALISQADQIAKQAEVSVTLPAPSHTDDLLGTGPKRLSWPLFVPVPLPRREREKLPFAREMVPSIRLDDTIDALRQKILSVSIPELSEESDKKQQYEWERVQKKVESEKQILNALIDQLEDCNKMLHQAYNERYRFHRG